MNQHRIVRVIKLMRLLQDKPRTIQSISRYLQVSERTVYRYLKAYESIGFEVNKTIYNKYTIHEPIRQNTRTHQTR